MREEGWILPRFRSCMLRPVRGVLSLRDERVDDLMRNARIARLVDPDTGVALTAPPALFDATLTRATADEWTLAGFERIEHMGRVVDYAQTWLISPVDLLR